MRTSSYNAARKSVIRRIRKRLHIRISAIFMATLMLFSVSVPVATIYIEYLQKADGSQRLMDAKQPNPIPNRVPEGAINPITRRPYIASHATQRMVLWDGLLIL